MNMTLSIEFWIQLLVYGVSFGTFVGVVKTKLSYIEKKLDKHNNLVERMYSLEKDMAIIKENNK